MMPQQEYVFVYYLFQYGKKLFIYYMYLMLYCCTVRMYYYIQYCCTFCLLLQFSLAVVFHQPIVKIITTLHMQYYFFLNITIIVRTLFLNV